MSKFDLAFFKPNLLDASYGLSPSYRDPCLVGQGACRKFRFEGSCPQQWFAPAVSPGSAQEVSTVLKEVHCGIV